MTITGGSALPEEDIERMVKEAEEHAAEDKARREAAEERNAAEQLVYSTEKVLKENDDKLADDVKTEVNEALTALKTALEDEDASTEDIKSKYEALVNSSQKIGEALYADAQSDGAGDAAGGAPAGDDAGDDEDVVDAEIVDEDDQK